MAEAIPDPNGAAEEPHCGQMQAIADALRGLIPGERDPARRATLVAASDMMDLQIDWLLEQHRIIAEATAP